MRSLIFGLVLLVALSGCHQPPPGWSLGANGHTEKVDGGVRFVGDVRTGGMFDNSTVSGIRVEFRDENGTLLRRVQVGTFRPGRDQAALNETFEEPPEFVLVKAESVDTPDRYDWAIAGLERTESGDYSGYSDYDPLVGTATAERWLVA